MTAPVKPWETTLQNSGNVLRTQSLRSSNPAIPQINSTTRSIPMLPPRPQQSLYSVNNYSSPYSQYSGLGGIGYGSYGSTPYRSSLYSPYNTYSGYNAYGGYGNYGARDIAEERFVQFAEERSRSTFTNVENIVRAFSSISMMLDNTFFAMTSSFRAVLSVAENFGRLRTVFGQIWYSVNIFRLLNWLYRKLRSMMGFKMVESTKSLAWKEAAIGATAEASGSGGSNWSTVAFLSIILSAPYLISKFLPKYEDKCDPERWKSSAIRAKAAFDFTAVNPNELTFNTNDEILLAPKYIQEEMKLTNTGWGYAECNGKPGLVPLNYLLIMQRVKGPNSSSDARRSEVPVPRTSMPVRSGKRVSFGETQFFETAEPDIVDENPQNTPKADVERSTEVISGNSSSEQRIKSNIKLEQSELKSSSSTDDSLNSNTVIDNSVSCGSMIQPES